MIVEIICATKFRRAEYTDDNRSADSGNELFVQQSVPFLYDFSKACFVLLPLYHDERQVATL